jgi:hypothetical protein
MKADCGTNGLVELNSGIVSLLKGYCGSVQLVANHKQHSYEQACSATLVSQQYIPRGIPTVSIVQLLTIYRQLDGSTRDGRHPHLLFHLFGLSHRYIPMPIHHWMPVHHHLLSPLRLSSLNQRRLSS